VFYTYTILAQEIGPVRKRYAISFPEKVRNPLGSPFAAGTYTIGTGGNFPTVDFDGGPLNSLTPDIGAEEGVVVPGENTSFTPLTSDMEKILSWSTATELNNDGYEILRKTLSGEFANVVFNKGQGTTTRQNHYCFTDKNTNEGNYFYPLKQMDCVGQYSYSAMVEVDVRMPDKCALEQNYPNPRSPVKTIGMFCKKKSVQN